MGWLSLRSWFLPPETARWGSASLLVNCKNHVWGGAARDGARSIQLWDRHTTKNRRKWCSAELYSTFDAPNKLTFFWKNALISLNAFTGFGICNRSYYRYIERQWSILPKTEQLSYVYHQNLYGFYWKYFKILVRYGMIVQLQTRSVISWKSMHEAIVTTTQNCRRTESENCGLEIYSECIFHFEKRALWWYDVSIISAIRKALSELEQRGFVKTLNGEHCSWTGWWYETSSNLALNCGYTKKALRYLRPASIINYRPAALATAPDLPGGNRRVNRWFLLQALFV